VRVGQPVVDLAYVVPAEGTATEDGETTVDDETPVDGETPDEDERVETDADTDDAETGTDELT
jgi:hypothetical protein